MSKTLQELRRIRIIHHVARGIDLLLDVPVVVDAEDYPEKALDVAVDNERLLVGDVPTSDAIRLARFRKGQAVVRKHTLGNYEHRCALCDVDIDQLLVASHISRWSDDAAARGTLSNIICLCKMHDALFEDGYFSIADDLSILKRPNITSSVILYLQKTSAHLRPPMKHSPSTAYMKKHRERTKYA